MAQLTTQAIDAQHGNALFTLSEICQHCGVHAEIIIEMVEYGVVEPAGVDAGQHWLFASDALTRLNRAQRLRRDLQLDLAGLALSLDLLDEIATLRREIAALHHQLQQSQRGGHEATVEFE